MEDNHNKVLDNHNKDNKDLQVQNIHLFLAKELQPYERIIQGYGDHEKHDEGLQYEVHEAHNGVH